MVLSNSRRTTGPRHLRSALLVAAVCAVALFATVGTASASTTTNRGAMAATSCPSSALCLYDGTNFTGAEFTVSSLGPGGTCVSLVDHGWGDRARSATNTHANSAAMFMNDDCLGGPFQVPGNSSIADFGTFRPESVWVPAS